MAFKGGEVSSDQLMEESYSSFKDPVESGRNSTFFTCRESDLDSLQLEAEKETRSRASSVETEQSKENSVDCDDKENV